VPDAIPVIVHVPAFAFVPLDAAASQSEGSADNASCVPLAAVAVFAGGDPVRSSNNGVVPVTVSTESSRALRTSTLYCNVMGGSYRPFCFGVSGRNLDRPKVTVDAEQIDATSINVI
jgi:hypothetical protein